MSRSTSNPIIIFLFEIVQERGRPRCGARVQAQPGGTGRGKKEAPAGTRAWERWRGGGDLLRGPPRVPHPRGTCSARSSSGAQDAAGVPLDAGTLTPGEPRERV